MDENKVVIFSGAGISAESGIQTFRDRNGLWEGFDPNEVASLEAWKECPDKVCAFHNDRLQTIEKACPNPAHLALVELEKKYEVVIITQNVDDLHERAGSAEVIHLHGLCTEVRSDPSDVREAKVYQRGYKPLESGETDEFGDRLRPDVVLFGEDIHHYALARSQIKDAGKVLVVGTSLQVQPAASVLKKAHYLADKVMIAKEIVESPKRFKIQRGDAACLVPILVQSWLR